MNKLDQTLVDRRPLKGRSVKIRAACLFLVFAFAALPAQAQGPGGPSAGAAAAGNSLAGGLAALAARVAKLEGRLVEADLVGTYTIAGIQNELRAGDPGSPPEISSYVYAGTVQLGADGTASFSVTENGHRLSFGSPSLIPGDNSEEINTHWTYDNGTVAIFDGEWNFSVAAGGRLLIRVSVNPDDGTDVLLILTRN